MLLSIGRRRLIIRVGTTANVVIYNQSSFVNYKTILFKLKMLSVNYSLNCTTFDPKGKIL